MKFTILLLLVAGVVVGFAGGFYVGGEAAYVAPIEGAVNLEEGQPEGVDFALFWDAWRIVQEEYAGAEPLSYQAMVHGAINGMIDSLGDPYTIFLEPEDTKIFFEDVKGSFSGVGIEIGIRDDSLRVVAPLEGTPAERAGLRAGDHIVAIDGESSLGISVDEAVVRIRGAEGTPVTLSIVREGWTEAKDFEIIRATISIPSLRWEMIDGVAYVKLFHFSDALRSDFARLDREVFRDTDKIVIDVRNNPGGFLHVAVDIAGWFLPRGETVLIEDFGSDLEPEIYRTRGNGSLGDHKVVILINEGSASASEILAGALRDNDGIQLVGTTSFGKGSVQEVTELKDGSSLKVTIANWLTPKGIHITGEGLEPDVVVEMTDEDFEEDRDPQLDKAIELVKNL